MTSFAIGDVVWIPFPYVERATFKSRPALVLTARPLGLDDALIWVAMITSAARPRWAGDVVIADLELAGLPGASVVRTAKIADARRRVGTLDRAAGRQSGRRGRRAGHAQHHPARAAALTPMLAR